MINLKTKRTNYEFLKTLLASTNSRRGHLREKIVFSEMKKLFSYDSSIEVLHNQYVEIPKNLRKRGKSQVDIMVINHNEKTINCWNVKSDGISRTDSAEATKLQYLEVINSLEVLYPEYSVSYGILRTSGLKIDEYENSGIKTYKINDYLNIDLDMLIADEYDTVKKEAFYNAINRNNVSIEEKTELESILFTYFI